MTPVTSDATKKGGYFYGERRPDPEGERYLPEMQGRPLSDEMRMQERRRRDMHGISGRSQIVYMRKIIPDRWTKGLITG